MVSWAPHESGCLLACASSDGHVSVLEFRDNNWTHQTFHAHGMGVNSISWAPAAFAGSLISSNPGPGQQRRFVTGGSDNLVKIWDYKYVLRVGGYGELCVLTSISAVPSLRLTISLRRWRATRTGSVTWPGRQAFYPSRISPRLRKTRPFGSGPPMLPTRASGPAKRSSSTPFSGVSAGVSAATFSLSAVATTRSACGRKTSRASGRRSRTLKNRDKNWFWFFCH